MSTIAEVQSHQEYYDKLDRQEYERLIERKCASVDCYHYVGRVCIYCNHCLHGVCTLFAPELQAEFQRLRERFH